MGKDGLECILPTLKVNVIRRFMSLSIRKFKSGMAKFDTGSQKKLKA